MTTNRNRYVLAIEDSASRFVVLAAMRNKEARTVTKVILERWVAVFGCPERIHSNLGSEFVAQVTRELCRVLDIQQSFAPC